MIPDVTQELLVINYVRSTGIHCNGNPIIGSPSQLLNPKFTISLLGAVEASSNFLHAASKLFFIH